MPRPDFQCMVPLGPLMFPASVIYFFSVMKISKLVRIINASSAKYLRAENLVREFIEFKEKRTLRRKRLQDNLRDERARQGIRKSCRRYDIFTVPLFDTIFSELSSSSSSEDDDLGSISGMDDEIWGESSSENYFFSSLNECKLRTINRVLSEESNTQSPLVLSLRFPATVFENLVREFIEFKEKRTLRRKRLQDNLRDERARQGIRKSCRRYDIFTVPLFDTIFSELSSSSSSEDDGGSGNTSWSSLLGANWRTLIDSDSN
ncbi:hypothetical protein K503DRAFT_821513 [Rhizopogon vinicolor AM-OR11-026]|uniref:Uncharacterized protein n=1 Tax=Rhizopogon vinicolor AM-OR11-026 TaxID=1314800 RepID=A0A1B7MY47_9AGAM|nr:hypothetical protein K503DRAFT_821513 [Rhizopogon vinicolor AM-OR11-026]